MLQKTARFFSIVFHPILATTYIYIIIFCSNSFVAFFPVKYKIALTTFVAINTIFLPLLLIMLLYRLKIIKSYNLKMNRERVFPLVISTLPYLLTIFIFARLQVPFILIKILQAGIYALLLSAAISYFWKISLHLIGLGGISGFLFVSAYQGNQAMVGVFLGSILLSGFTASARLIDGDHKPIQVYVGFLAGFTLILLLLF